MTHIDWPALPAHMTHWHALADRFGVTDRTDQLTLHVQEIIAMRGVPGSGKTTWATEHMRLNPDYKRISRDELRAMLGEPFSPASEQTVMHLRNALAGSLLSLGYSVIIDDTNLTAWHLTSLRALASGYSAGFRIHTMPTALSDCIDNDIARSLQHSWPKAIGARRITEMWAQLQQTLTSERETGITDG